jgi:hypothetical protein
MQVGPGGGRSRQKVLLPCCPPSPVVVLQGLARLWRHHRRHILHLQQGFLQGRGGVGVGGGGGNWLGAAALVAAATAAAAINR